MNTIERYDDRERVTHWAIALLFVLAALSGLALFHPSLFFFANFFGGGPWTRILHPFIGVAMFIAFVLLAARVWRHNRWTDGDREWMKHSGELIRGNETVSPQTGKYNAGQKLVFWVSVVCLVVLLVTGFLFWRPWFAPYVPVELIRVAALLHAIAATVLIIAIIVHVYAAIWIKGSVRAMTRGTVSQSWARRHHPLWHGEMNKGK